MKKTKQGIDIDSLISADKGTLPAQDITLEKLNIELPFSSRFSSEDRGREGSVTIGKISTSDYPSLSLAAKLHQQGHFFLFSGEIQPSTLPDAAIGITGKADIYSRNASFSWSIDKAEVSSDNLLLPGLPEGTRFDATLSNTGSAVLDASGFRASNRLSVADGSFSDPDNEIFIGGIDCSLDLPELPAVFSLPSQQCRIASLSVGSFLLNDVAIDFRLENTNTVFIEKSKAGWCRGKVESTGFRFSAKSPEVDTVFYCSRINFSDLLAQFGLNHATGEGTVNGKLPVKLTREGIRFDDGFLFSTPGAGGIIKFADTKILRKGVEAGDQTGYLEYTMHAMQNFSYNWTKISFNSPGPELLLAIELDGEPSNPLPYRLLENGVITKSDQGTGLQYPIRMDVNFNLPLADLFRVGQNFQSLKGEHMK